MNSLDPWRLIVTDASGDVILPQARYGHPFYSEVPSWINYQNDSAPRTLFDGAFISGDIGDNMTNNIGAELTALSAPGYPYGPFFRPYGYGNVFFGAEGPPDVNPPVVVPGPQRTGLTKELAPILAPATGGISVKKHLDENQILHVEICVDGKCHSTSMNLAPAIALVMEKLAKWHQAQHAPVPPPSTVVSTVQAAVGAAEDMLVGALVARHIDTVAAGILGDIAGAVKGAVSGLAGGVSSTFKKLKGPIGAAAGIAAAAGASAIPGIGPIAAPMAAKLANDLVQSVGGDEKAQKKVADAAQQAKTDPTVALALEQATKAVANSTAAHHIQDTAKKAAKGDAQAQQQIVKVADDAQKGDPAAKAVADLVANAMKSEWGAKLWEGVTGRGPSTISGEWYDIVGNDPYGTVVGSFWDKVKDGLLTVTLTKQTNQFIKDNGLEPYVKMAATAVATAYGGPAAGAAAGALSGPVMSLGVKDKQQAQAAQKAVQGVKAKAQQTNPQLAPAVDVAHAAIDQTATAYQVSQMVKDAHAGIPGALKAIADLRAAAARGDQQAIAAIQAVEAIEREQQKPPGITAGEWYDIAGVVIGMAHVGCPSYGGAVGQWYDVIGAVLDDAREKARAHAVTKPGAAAGVVISVDGRLHGRGFRNLDDAIDWLQHITRNRGSFTYAAAYDKDTSGAAFIQAEEIGGSTAQPASPAPIPREGPAVTSGW